MPCVLVLSPLSIDPGKTTTNTARAGQAELRRRDQYRIRDASRPHRQGDDYQVSANPDRNCDGLAPPRRPGTSAAAIIGCRCWRQRQAVRATRSAMKEPAMSPVGYAAIVIMA